MVQNTLPSGIHELLELAARLLAGRETHGPWLGLGTAEEFAAALAALRTAESALAAARVRKAEAGRRSAAADAALTGWLARARLVLMLALGSGWSERWSEAGFTRHGTNVPKRLGARLELGRRVAEYFEKHPEYAVPFAAVTADAGHAAYAALTAATHAQRATAGIASERQRTRDAAEKHLRWKMRGTVILLSVALDPGDPRWLAFGLNVPRPGAPGPQRRGFAPPPAEMVRLAPAPAVPWQAVA